MWQPRNKLWKLGLGRPPIGNVPRVLRSMFLLGLENRTVRNPERLRDMDGRNLDSQAVADGIEFVLPWKFLLERDQNKRGSYDIMADFTVWLSEFLQERGQAIVPLVNFDKWKNLPRQFSSRRISWHTTGSAEGHLHLKIGVYPEFVAVDEEGFSGWSSFSRKPAPLGPHGVAEEEYFEDLRKSLVEAKESKYLQPESTQSREVTGSYVFFPMQIPSDVVADLAWIDTVSLLKILANFAPGSPRKIVAKRHPKCTSRRVSALIESVKGTPNLHFTNGNVHDLIRDCDAVVTVNSGVGAEALLHRKTIIVTGASDYMAAAIHARTADALLEVLRKSAIPGPDVDIESFVFGYCRNYMIQLGDLGSLAQHETLRRFVERPSGPLSGSGAPV